MTSKTDQTEWEISARPDGVTGRAQFSVDRTRRLVLIRRWVHGFDPGSETLTWVMLNPSSAGAHDDDATIRKCVGYAKRWGFGGIRVLNLFDLIATDPRRLRAHEMPSSPLNDEAWQTWIHPWFGGKWEDPPPVIAAWGDVGDLAPRAQWAVGQFRAAGIRPRCLGLTKTGHPLHPSRTSYDLTPTTWGAD